MRAGRLCHTRSENSGDEALGRPLLGRGGSCLRANLRDDLRNACHTRLRALRRRDPFDELSAMRERERVEPGPELCRRERASEIGRDRHGAWGGVDLERDPSAPARDELRGVADFLARWQVVPAAVDGDRRTVLRAVQRHANGYTLSRAELLHDRLGNLDQQDTARIWLRDRRERDRAHERVGVGVFTDPAANAGIGRVKPLRVRSPTDVVSVSASTAAWTRWLSRTCPAFASAERRCARITTLPRAP